MISIKSSSLTSTSEINSSNLNFIVFSRLMKCSLTFFFIIDFISFISVVVRFVLYFVFRVLIIALRNLVNCNVCFIKFSNRILSSSFSSSEQWIANFSLNFSNNLWKNQALRNVLWSFSALINFSEITMYWRQYWEISFKDVRTLSLKISRYCNECSCWLRFLFL
jgi:hypothetical protein